MITLQWLAEDDYWLGSFLRQHPISGFADPATQAKARDIVHKNRIKGLDGVLGGDYTICAGRDEPSSGISRSEGSKRGQ